jgi:hypothetical protein
MTIRKLFRAIMLPLTVAAALGLAVRAQVRKSNAANVDELKQLELKWHHALEAGDIAALDRLLAPGWFITNGSGHIIPKSELLEGLRSGEIKFVSTIPTEIDVHLYEHAAVITKRSTDKTMYGSTPGGGKYQMTDMFVKQDRRWQCIATHASRDLN